eukprot:4563424-Prymnesium_polylepis.2
MGGLLADVTVMGLGSSHDTTNAFANFDAHKADCFLAEDKEHLLAVLEAGFGDLHGFNRTARHMLKQRTLDDDDIKALTDQQALFRQGSDSVSSLPGGRTPGGRSDRLSAINGSRRASAAYCRRSSFAVPSRLSSHFAPTLPPLPPLGEGLGSTANLHLVSEPGGVRQATSANASTTLALRSVVMAAGV